jgi:hypothetical protein
MRSWKLRLVLAAAAVLALAVTVFVRRGVVETLLMILIGSGLVGLYFLRRYARAELLYRRHAERPRRPHRTEPEPVSNAHLVEATRPDLAVPGPFTPGPNHERPVPYHDMSRPGASLRCR